MVSALPLFIAAHILGFIYGIYSYDARTNVFAQWAHETALFSSDPYQRANNLSGMKNVQGYGNASGGYESYSSPYISMVHYFRRNSDFNVAYRENPRLFASELQESGYYTDSLGNYAKGLSKRRSQIPTWWHLVVCMLALGIPLGLLYIIIKNWN
jgi:hypothetical protein